MTLMRSVQCKAKSTRSGRQCARRAVLGATVCRVHGGAAPQVKAAAARRVTLSEAIAQGDHRHPGQVLASALHVVDVAGQQLLAALDGGLQVTPEAVQTLLDAARSQASMAKLVLDANGGDLDRWSAQEVMRSQGEALARVCREMARQLGHDPAAPLVEEAFSAAVGVVVHGRRPGKPLVAATVPVAPAVRVAGRRTMPAEVEAHVVEDDPVEPVRAAEPAAAPLVAPSTVDTAPPPPPPPPPARGSVRGDRAAELGPYGNRGWS